MTPIRSPRYDNVVGKLLTDRRITQYIREGKYGVAAQEEQLAYDKLVAERKIKKAKAASILDLL